MEEKKMILKMIEEGKITAEEGFKLIEALETKNTKNNENEKEFTGYHSSANRKEENREQFQRFKTDLHETTEKIIGSANKGATKLLDLIGKAVDKLQTTDLDFDLDFNWNGGIKVSETVIVPDFHHEQLRFAVANGSIRVRTWERDDAQFEVIGVVSKVRDEIESRQMLKEVIEYGEKSDGYEFHIQEKKGVRASVEVYLPYQEYQELNIEGNNGSIRISDIECKRIESGTSNGSIRMHSVTAGEIVGQTSNGRIQCKQIDTKVTKWKTSNGSIHLSGEMNTVECETTNGNVRIEEENLEKSHIKAVTTNGMIRVYYLPDVDGVYGELSTNHGQIQCDLPHTLVTDNGKQGNKMWYHFEQGDKRVHYVTALTNTGSVYVLEREE